MFNIFKKCSVRKIIKFCLFSKIFGHYNALQYGYNSEVLLNCISEIGVKESTTGGPAATTKPANARTETPQEVVLRRTQSFEADEK